MNKFEQEYQDMIATWHKSMPIQRLKARVEQAGEVPLVLYGAGRLAGVFLNACHALKIPVTGICDRSVKGEYLGYAVMSPEELTESYSHALVLVCSHSFNHEICASLENAGLKSEQVIPCPMEYPYFQSPEGFTRYYKGYAWAYDFFEDARSKQLILDRMALYLTDRGLTPNSPSPCYYENGLIQLSEKEVFVDGGAFIGDSVAYFINRQCGKYSHIYAFEPSANNFRQAAELLRQYRNVELILKGLGSKDCTLTFYQDTDNPAGSKFIAGAGKDENLIDITSLDIFFQNMPDDELPTFIKMDIEGSEKEALIGAAKTIRRNKPQLAICAYHKPEDIYELPQTILGIRDDYRFALRQHEYGCYDTVLYAI